MSSLLPLNLPSGLDLHPDVVTAINDRMERIAIALRTLGNTAAATTAIVTPAAKSQSAGSVSIASSISSAGSSLGFSQGVIAARPTSGQPRLYYATDQGVLYGTDGTDWKYLSGTMYDVLSNLPATLGTSDVGFLFFATDQTILYRWNGTTWIYESGTLRNVFSARPSSLGTAHVGFLFYATDRTVLYYWDGTDWNYQSGTMSETQSNLAALAATLGSHDAGLPVWVTDYAHMLEWNGTGWQRGAADPEHSDTFWGFGAAPSDTGWHACDGSVVSFLKYDGTLGSRTLPDANGTACYAKMGSTYADSITAAAAPTFTGTGGTTGATSAGTPAGTVTSGFSGDTLPSHAHHAPISYSGGNAYVLNIAGTGGGYGAVAQLTSVGSGATVVAQLTGDELTTLTPSGTVSSTFAGSAMGTHTHSFTPAGTISLSGGDPVAWFEAIAYYRQ